MSLCRPWSRNQTRVQRSASPPSEVAATLLYEQARQPPCNIAVHGDELDARIPGAEVAAPAPARLPCCVCDEAAGLTPCGITARTLAPSKEALDTPLSPTLLNIEPGPATGLSGTYPGGTYTHWSGPAFRTHHRTKSTDPSNCFRPSLQSPVGTSTFVAFAGEPGPLLPVRHVARSAAGPLDVPLVVGLGRPEGARGSDLGDYRT